MRELRKLFKNKKIIITGHTGFKGSWLSLWLLKLGAKVIGISNGYTSTPSHFKKLYLKKNIKNYNLDIREFKKLKKIFLSHNPDYIFHLAAQAIVKKSYKNPLYNWETNTLGTINILESLRHLKKKCVAVLITSDKSYKNLEINRGYKEDDLLGGFDPYSASKGSAEFAIQSYVKSFFSKNDRIRIGVGRAGNVVGGGDWSEDRLIPDCVKSWSKGKRVVLRNPNATRPWQHVLEAVYGYLTLAQSLSNSNKNHGEVFNFGPSQSNNFKVINVVYFMKKNWQRINWTIKKSKNFKESKLLKLNSNKAKKILKWKNHLTFKNTIKLVAEWYKDYYDNKKSTYKISCSQIDMYQKILNKNF
tara:strand:+ start:250 stop:1326 length:1077 start_codon:yes stop_codon:yes gene_type:complete